MRDENVVLFVGPMKAGTTWIYDYLASRGDVSLPIQVKETFFLDRHFEKGVPWYRSHFDSILRPLIVEVAPSYFASLDVPARAHSILPSARIIITLRDPVKRAWSHYLHLRRYGYTTLPLQEAALEFPQILRASRYNECIQLWSKYYSSDRVSVVWQEDMLSSLDNYANSICDILGVTYTPIPDNLRKRSNEAAVAPSSTLASLGRKVSYALRDRRLYFVVNYAKRLGLKKYFFGEPGNIALPTLKSDEAEWLCEQLKDDYNSLPSKYKHSSVDL